MFILNSYRFPSFINDNSLSFDGTNEYVSIADDASIDFDKDEACSFSFWVNAASTIATATPTQLLDKRDGSNNGYNISFFDDKVSINFF